MRQIYSEGKLFVPNRVWFETAESVKTGYDNLFVNANPVKLSQTGKISVCRAETNDINFGYFNVKYSWTGK